ncbi:alpha/beta hydrolase [Neptunomonas japonica]|uniref:alpha/beta hydrolase n=1 Tax=Neptunomonas japonica TaxID=417574 RepID=UPI0004168C58|nr:alpha/beta hydrolase [Neptunomonas japonica]
MYKTLLNSAALLLFTAQPLFAQEVTTKYEDLTLNAQMQLAEGSTLADGIILITHGTLAHNKMELVETLQLLLSDSGLNSLAINLSLGISDRHGMYDCQVPHQHKHTDALNEISVWAQWLKNQGAQNLVLMGHSRGGNQTAWFTTNNPTQLKAQILLAPATWTEEGDNSNYQQRYSQSLSSVLLQAEKTDKNTWLEDTNFIYCANSQVKAESFLNYYQADERFNTPFLLNDINTPTLVISASEDKTVSDLPKMMSQVSNSKVEHSIIEGADHYFRDLYADEVVELVVDFLEKQE